MGTIADRFAAKQRTGVLPPSRRVLRDRISARVYGRTPTSDRVEAERKTLKGVYLGNCNITACQAPGAVWWNIGSRSWYCRSCAKDINRFPVDGLGKLCFDRGIYIDDWTDVLP